MKVNVLITNVALTYSVQYMNILAIKQPLTTRSSLLAWVWKKYASMAVATQPNQPRQLPWNRYKNEPPH